MGDGTQTWRKDPKKKGWHSRRHDSSDPHANATRNHRRNHSAEARKIRALERASITRTPEQQLQALESRGHGHCSEARALRADIELAAVDKSHAN